MSRNEHGHGEMAKQTHTTLELKPKQREHYQFREGLRAERDSQPRVFQQSTAQRAKRATQRSRHPAQEDRDLCYTWLGFSCVLYKLLETNRCRSPQIYQTRRLMSAADCVSRPCCHPRHLLLLHPLCAFSPSLVQKRSNGVEPMVTKVHPSSIQFR